MNSVSYLSCNPIESRSVDEPISAAEGRITNGKNAAVGQFPYQVGLSLVISATEAFWCGGSLISNEWVLTAGHCTKGVQSVTVYLGATKRNSPEKLHTVSKDAIIIHSDYDDDTLENDISLIKIPYTDFTSNIQKVKLPKIARFYPTYAGKKAIISGWGRISDSSKVSPNHLQWANTEVISNADCAAVFGSSIKNSNICVSTSGSVSTCQGDSGGPLVLNSKTKILIGVTSFVADKGCEIGAPAGFARTTHYLNWIKDCSGVYY